MQGWWSAGFTHRAIIADPFVVADNGSVVTATRRSWAVWGVGVAAYAGAVFQRTSLAVAAEDATARFEVSAAVLSLFAVVQLITYAAMQIPVGVLVDRFGSRIMIAGGAAVMAAGQVALALVDTPWA